MAPQRSNNSNEDFVTAEEMELLKQALSASKKYMAPTAEEQEKTDARSVYVGNVDWKSTVSEIEEHFAVCGKVARVTIPKDKFTGYQKNFAFVEFQKLESVQLALVLSGTMFRNRKIMVTLKRTNKPGMGRTATAQKPAHFAKSSHGKPGSHQGVTVVKYVYVNAPINGSRSKRFAPY